MKQFYSLQDLADCYGTSVKTISNHIKKLKEEKKFQKKSFSKSYDHTEAQTISQLLNFRLEVTKSKLS